jgi:hypothetical protein
MYGGRGPTYIGGDVNININNSRNMYNNRGGVTTSDIKRNNGNNHPASKPPNGPQGTAKKNDVLLDRQGNVYKPGEKGNWQQFDSKDWKPSGGSETSNLNRQMENRERSNNRNNNFNETKAAPKRMSGPARR